jgi:hypothetical protein
MTTIQPPLWLTIFLLLIYVLSLHYKLMIGCPYHNTAAPKLPPYQPHPISMTTTHPHPYRISTTDCPCNSCLIVSLVFPTKCTTSYVTFVPGHWRDNRETRMFSIAVKGSRDEKLGECVAR